VWRFEALPPHSAFSGYSGLPPASLPAPLGHRMCAGTRSEAMRLLVCPWRGLLLVVDVTVGIPLNYWTCRANAESITRCPPLNPVGPIPLYR
jgi:hypothetical protein